MSTIFTKEEKKYFDFLLDMGFIIDEDLSDGHCIYFRREFEGSFQTISIDKDGFIGKMIGVKRNTFHFCLRVCTNCGGPVEECTIPQQSDSYETSEIDDENKKNKIFDKYKTIILDSLKNYEESDHLTGYMDEHIYINYISIAKSTGFIPKSMEELNQYALNLRDMGGIDFKDYIYIISSLLILFLIENTDLNNLVLYNEEMNSYTNGLEISNKELLDYNRISFSPTIVTKLMWSKKNSDLFIACREHLEKFFKNKKKLL